MKAQTENFNFFIKKPWGWEYSLLATGEVSITYLNINSHKSTSLHCHPNKRTGYVVLQGEVEIEFLSSRKRLGEGQCVNFREGLFHKTTAGSNGATVLELESPPNKLDLVRLEDEAGRKDSTYEEDLYELPTDVRTEHARFRQILTKAGPASTIEIGRCIIRREIVSAAEIVAIENKKLVLSILNKTVGTNTKVINAKVGTIMRPGDITTLGVLKRMLPILEFTGEYDLFTVEHLPPEY